jgi:hypothetical protein
MFTLGANSTGYYTRTIIYMQLMRRFKCSQESSVFFFFLVFWRRDGGLGRGICFCNPQFCSHCFPIKFARGSLQVPKLFLICFQYHHTFILSHMLWPKLNFDKYTLQRQANGKHLCAFILESAQYFKNSGDGSINVVR